jgi:hypothetical protein
LVKEGDLKMKVYKIVPKTPLMREWIDKYGAYQVFSIDYGDGVGLFYKVSEPDSVTFLSFHNEADGVSEPDSVTFLSFHNESDGVYDLEYVGDFDNLYRHPGNNRMAYYKSSANCTYRRVDNGLEISEGLAKNLIKCEFNLKRREEERVAEYTYTVTNEFITIYFKDSAKSMHVAGDNEEVKKALRECASANELRKIVDEYSFKQKESLNESDDAYMDEADYQTLCDTFDELTYKSGCVYYRNYRVPDRLAALMAYNSDKNSTLNFLAKLMMNPKKEIVDELYDFIVSNNMTILPNGNFLAYRKVRGDFTDFYTGTFDYSPGNTVEQLPSEVDTDRSQTCSRGLHFCAYSYLSEYYGNMGRIILVEISPADVGAIPTDYNNAKGRCWRMYVHQELPKDEAEKIYSEYGANSEPESESESESESGNDLEYLLDRFFNDNTWATNSSYVDEFIASNNLENEGIFCLDDAIRAYREIKDKQKYVDTELTAREVYNLLKPITESSASMRQTDIILDIIDANNLVEDWEIADVFDMIDYVQEFEKNELKMDESDFADEDDFYDSDEYDSDGY